MCIKYHVKNADATAEIGFRNQRHLKRGTGGQRMQIVIDIPEIYYEALKEADVIISGQQSGKTLMYDICSIIANGTPLPEEHGRLVDGDSLWNKMSYYSDDRGAGVDYLNDDVNPIIFRDSAMEVIENAPTIIPATKGK